jgi:hypothetical protein
VTIRIAPFERELQFQRHGLQLAHARLLLAEQRPVHRAGGTARADQVTTAKCLIEDVVLTLPPDILDGVFEYARSRALEQPGIEFKAADRVLHAGDGQPQALEVPLQAAETQKSVRVGGDVEFQVGDHLGRDPAGAEFQTRKARLVQHQHIGAGAAQASGSGGAGRSASHDNDIGALHRT